MWDRPTAFGGARERVRRSD